MTLLTLTTSQGTSGRSIGSTLKIKVSFHNEVTHASWSQKKWMVNSHSIKFVRNCIGHRPVPFLSFPPDFLNRHPRLVEPSLFLNSCSSISFCPLFSLPFVGAFFQYYANNILQQFPLTFKASISSISAKLDSHGRPFEAKTALK